MSGQKDDKSKDVLAKKVKDVSGDLVDEVKDISEMSMDKQISTAKPVPIPKDSVATEVFPFPESCGYKMVIKDGWKSICTVFQSPLCQTLGLMASSSEYSIAPFSDAASYWSNYMDLSLRIWDLYRGSREDIPKNDRNHFFRAQFPTDFDKQGIDLMTKVVDVSKSWFISLEVAQQMRSGILHFTNNDLPSLFPKTRESCVNILLPEERKLCDELASMERDYHVIDMVDIDTYLSKFKDWYVFAEYNSQVYEERYRKGYHFFKHTRVNYNYQILGDQFGKIRDYSFNLIASNIAAQMKFKVRDSGKMRTDLLQKLQISSTRMTEKDDLVSIITMASAENIFPRMMAGILCSRWYTYSDWNNNVWIPNAARIVDYFIIYLLFPSRAVDPRQDKYMQEYLIRCYFCYYFNQSNDVMLSDINAFVGVDNPIVAFFNTHVFQDNRRRNNPALRSADSTIKAFFSRTVPGEGFAGCGMNQRFRVDPVGTPSERFTVNSYEPIFGERFYPLANPNPKPRWQLFYDMVTTLSELRVESTNSDAIIRVRAVNVLLTMVLNNAINVNYLCQLMERVNYYWTDLYYAAPSSDEPEFNKPVHMSNMPRQDFVSIQSWNSIQKIISSTSVQEKIKYNFRPGSIYSLLMYYDYAEPKKVQPPYQAWFSGWSANEDLREFGGMVFLAKMYMNQDFFLWSDVLKRVLTMIGNGKLMSVVKSVFESGYVGYPGMDGLDFYINSFTAVRKFLEIPRIRSMVGLCDGFYKSNRISEHIVLGDNNDRFLYANCMDDIPENVYVLEQQTLQETAANQVVRRANRESENKGRFVKFNVPLRIDLSPFKLTTDGEHQILDSHFDDDCLPQKVIEFSTSGKPYLLSDFKFSFIWRDDTKRRDWIVNRKPLSISIPRNNMPIIVMNAGELLGLIGYSPCPQKIHYDYHPISREVDSLSDGSYQLAYTSSYE